MASIIEGYNYDIFISYRQKDNKYDGWVTEFVDNLKKELESASKEEVSVYFDINPQDGLLETHDVAASLEEKLKCLVFIPILSRTYCDPKSYAWDHEFKAFVEQSSKDQFGLKVNLPGGNVANRVLPVRINDLSAADIKLCESIFGGVLRGVDFIYKEPGVNRPLRSNEENPHDNLNHTIYRNQINKVSLAVMDIIESMKVSGYHYGIKEKEIQVKESAKKKESLIDEPGKKDIYKLKQELQEDKLKSEKDGKFLFFKSPRILIPGVIISLVILISSILILNHRSKVRWAKEVALPQIQQFVNEFNMRSAFNLIQKTEKYISEEPKFKELASLATSEFTILTDTPGADVYIREYSDNKGEWKKIGSTPLDSIKMPSFTFYLTRIEKPGYEDVLAITTSDLGQLYRKDTLYRKLFREGSIAPEMVYVEGYKEEVAENYLKSKNGFFMDRYEVNNKQYKEFVDNGGYKNPQFWKNKFIKNGKILTWEQAMNQFTDKSGRQGPATWEAGDYPDGQDHYPVNGISWYEAAAYAEYAGKSLPTAYHWYSGSGAYMDCFNHYFNSKILPISNFFGKGPEPIGKLNGISCFGTYDMAGNVREWCWNETPLGHIVCGGGWDDASYMYFQQSQLPAFDRSNKNGFRCVKYIDKEKIPESAFNQIEYNENRDLSKIEPIQENIFRIYKNQFLYDKKELNATVEKRDESSKDWILEKISFNAAYSDERVIVYLYLPKNISPPFQTIIFFPGIYAHWGKDLANNFFSNWNIDFVIKNGRAVMYPVYKGTYERKDGMTPDMLEPNQSHQYTDWLIKWVKDFKRSIDYLETRPDLDKTKLGFYGHSWGGSIGGIIPAVEDRLAVCILNVGGFWGRALTEADAGNYVPSIKIPVLMLNGRYDMIFPLEKAVKPFFNLLGTPEKDKRLIVYETDHYVPKSEMIKETLNWLDKYLGPVEMKAE
jgi:eukaryotic-like serine/threonine-protein kinase